MKETDCATIERIIGRELSIEEMCACGIAILDGHTAEQIANDLIANNKPEH